MVHYRYRVMVQDVQSRKDYSTTERVDVQTKFFPGKRSKTLKKIELMLNMF